MAETSKRLDLRDFVPPEWTSVSPDGSIWLTLYRAHGIEFRQFPQMVEVVDLPSMGVKTVCLYGELEYPDSRGVSCEFTPSGEPRLESSKMDMKCKSDGLHVAFMTPFSHPTVGADMRLEQEHVSAAEALFMAVLGRQILFYHLADLRFFVSSGDMVIHFRGFEHPGWNQSPDVGPEQFQTVRLMSDIFNDLSDQEKNRIHMSLRWFGMARVSVGVDAFLKFWIALETLAMKDSTKIGPIKKILAKCYAINNQQVGERFRLGRLCKIRGEIVHQGKIKNMQSEVLRYIEAVFLDVLFHRLNIPCEKRAEAFLQQCGMDVSQLLP